MMKKAVKIFIVLSAIVGTATTVKGLLILFAVYLDTLRSSKRLKIKRKG